MGPVDVTTNPILHSVVSNQETQEKDLNALNASISNKLNTEFSNIDVINQSGVIGGCQIAPRASFRESFIYILTRFWRYYIFIILKLMKNLFLIFMIRLNLRICLKKHGLL
ncbi:hypothetical protein HVW15_01025 [Escherichia fergusonii]|uniref:hypothetical protein n=1 Tax=Escherichia fergusonii TaxID=564 RepID=UPI0015F7135E|nr:hypothetical protein [Escherichia fergusonii]MBA8499607.1 hypothetical protein [Escherichia fergusonii]